MKSSKKTLRISSHGVNFSLSMFITYCDSTVLSHCVPQDGVTALMLASYSGGTYVVQLLLSSGAKVDLQDKVRHKHQLDSYVLSHSWHHIFVFNNQLME